MKASVLIAILSGGLAVPDAPTPTAPANAAVLDDTTPEFSWSAVPGATSYDIEIRAMLTGTPTATGITGTTYTPSALDADITYSWRVRAVNAAGASAWSSTRAFSWTMNAWIQQKLVDTGAALVWLDGTLNTTKIANKGSLGSAVDGTPTNVTINANGMNFDGDTSKVVIPQHASLTSMDAQEYVFDATPVNAGEGSTGVFYRWGLGINRAVYLSSGSTLNFFVDYNTTDASVFIATPTFARRQFFFSHDAGTNIPSILIGNAGSVSTPTQTTTAGSSAVVAPAVDLVIGNNGIDTGGFNGAMKLVLICNRVLTSAERTKLAVFLAA